ncbi:MAG: hypothetical protein WD048_10450 [Chitinophagales bacterium]
MIYLQELLHALYSEELEKLKSLHLRGVEAKVFEYVKSQDTSFSVPEAANSLDISEAHFRKVHSKLLQKAYDKLVPEGEVKLLHFLSRRYLHNQVKHELFKLEKKLLESSDKNGLEHLFFNAVELFLNANLEIYDANFLKELRKKYTQYGKEQAEYKHVIIELQEYYNKVSYISRKYAVTDQKRIDFLKDIDQKLNYFEQQLLSVVDPLAHFWFYYFKVHYYENSGVRREKKQALLYKVIEVYDKNSHCFPEYFKINPTLNLALTYYDQSDFELAYKYFEKIFTQYPEWMKGAIFYVDIFIQLHIAMGKYAKAGELIYFYYRFDKQKPYKYNGKNFGALSILGLVYLLEENYETAYKCIQKAQQLCVKTNFYYLESMIRIFENAYFFLIDDFVVSEQLTAKNIKFHQYKKCGAEGDFFMGFHRLITAFSKYKFDHKIPNEKHKLFYKQWQSSEFAFIGQLLKKMKNEIDLKNWPDEE